MSTEALTMQPKTDVPQGLSPWREAPRAPRYLVVGLVLMVGFSLLFGLLAVRADPATPVLAVAQPVPAGSTITDADLAVVRVVPDPGVELVTEADRASVVGQTAAVPLVAGSLLAPAQVGPPDWPPAGRSVVAVAVPGGRLPAGLVAGAQVSVLGRGAPAGDSPDGPPPVAASVVEVAVPDVSGTVVVSLLLATRDAHQVAASGDDIALVLEPSVSQR